MAFPDPLALKDSAAAAMSLTRRVPIPNGNRYVHTLATPASTYATEIRSLLVSPKGGEKYNRNIITFSHTVTDAEDVSHVGSVSISQSRPLAADLTDAHFNTLWAMLAEFLIVSSGDYKTRFMRGEV